MENLLTQMRKKIFLLLLGVSVLGWAQENKYEILYQYIYQTDKDDPGSFKDEEMVLFTDGTESFFQSYVKYREDSLMQKDLNDGMSQSAFLAKALSRGYGPFPKITSKLEKDFKKQQYIYNREVGSDYFQYSEPFSLQWKIHNDSVRDYHGMKTILATTSVDGRDFKVWFAPEIPISDGPYVFQGLPGLVVWAKEKEGHVEFKMNEIRKVDAFHYKEYKPFKTEKIVKSTKEEYKKAKDYYDKNTYKILKQKGIVVYDENKKELKDK